MGSATYYKMIESMGIPAGRRGKYKKEKVKGKISDYVPAETKEETKVSSPAVIEAPQQIVLNGLNLAYNGSYKSDEIRRILAKIDLVLDGEENDFQIELRVSEIVKDKEEEKEESKELLNV
jgi:myo-inositol-1-phosphate synthase